MDEWKFMERGKAIVNQRLIVLDNIAMGFQLCNYGIFFETEDEENTY